MKNRSQFAKGLATLDLTHTERAIAFLWYYRSSQDFDERSASQLATDLQEERFPKPNITRLKQDLQKSKYTVKGKRQGTFQLDIRRIPELDGIYNPISKAKKYEAKDTIIPADWVANKRKYLEDIVNQINGSYEVGFFDACAAMMRRLMESLIIEVYIKQNRQQFIQENGVFVMLEKLIARIRSDQSVIISRNTPKTMTDIKQLGDTAAHDRVYITQEQDISDLKARYRKLIQELLNLSGIRV
jgi:hypothetical protein